MAAVATMSPVAASSAANPDLTPRSSSAGSLSHPQSEKQITSTTNSSGGTQGKRPRGDRPCDGCRKRKSKCIIESSSPPCVTCRFHKQDCTFLEGPVPRKRKVTEGSNNDVAQARRRKVNGHPPPRQVRESLMRGYTDSGPTAMTIDPSSTLDDTLSLQRHRHCRYLGPSSPLDIFLLANCHFDSSDETQLPCGDIRQVADGIFFEMIPDNTYETHEEELQALHDIEQLVGPHGPALIGLYFEMVHPSFPIVQRRVFMDRHNHGDRTFHSSLLAAVYVLALGWWSHEPSLAQHSMPSIEALEAVAFRSLGLAMQQPKLSSLQAGLLLLQRQHANAWPLTMQLVSLAQDLGLHLDCSAWSIPLWERRLRKLLAWAVYMQDKWGSLVFGRPSHIDSSTWAVPALTFDDFDEEVHKTIDVDPEVAGGEIDTANAMIFLQMVELTAIMAEVVNTFYTQCSVNEIARAGSQATQLILQKAKPVQIRLKEWFARLPPEVKLETDLNEANMDQQPLSVAHLHLAYFATEISIHRRIVQALANMPTVAGGSKKSQENYTLYICRSAAKTRLISAMDFVNRLRPAHLDAFWYFPSCHNFALIATFGHLLRATAPGYEEAAFYEMRLAEYRWALTVSARRAGWINAAVEALDLTAGMLEGLPEKPRSGQVTPASRTDSAHGRERH